MNSRAPFLIGLIIFLILSPTLAWGAATQMYWLDWDRETLERANVDGSNREVLISGGLSKPRNVCLDIQAGKMYFCTAGKIERANLDGSGRELLISLGSAQHMALDLIGGKMYWVSPGAVRRAELDGADVETLISGLPDLDLPGSIAIDSINNKMYWTDWGISTIKRADLDGSQIETLIDAGKNAPWDIELDIGGERIYWVHQPGPGGEIRSANFDGSDDRVVMHTSNPRYIALDMEAGKIFVANLRNIYVANLDGSGGTTLFSNILPQGIAVNAAPLPAIEVAMKITPRALNLRSRGKWVKAHLTLPKGLGAEGVDTTVPITVVELGLEAENIKICGKKKVMASFDRAAFCRAGPFEGPIVVEGSLVNGRRFRGSDTIKIVNNRFRLLPALASYWLETGCGRPDWCGGLDIDRDGVVDFADFALLDGCCR
jgi:hypothetical protein